MTTSTEIKFYTVGKGGTVHGSTDGETTLCGKTVARLVNVPGATLGCKACTKAAESLNTTNEENENVTETAKPTEDEIDAQVKADVENIIATLATLTKDDGDKIKSLEGQAETELLKITANKRAGLRMQLKHAMVEARNRKAGAQIVLKPETKDVTQIRDYQKIVDNAASLVAEGIKSNVNAHENARKVAEAILDGRLRVINKQGKPDLKGDRKQSKDLAKAIYEAAAKKLHAEQWGADASVDYETLEKQLRDKVQYQMTAVLPAFIYSLDNSPEQFSELFPAEAAALAEVKAENPDAATKPSDLVFALYGVNRKSKAELAAERRANKALTSGKKEGEDSDENGEEGENEGENESAKTKSTVEKLAEALDKDAKALAKVKVDELTDTEAEALREKLMAFTTTLQNVGLALMGRKPVNPAPAPTEDSESDSDNDGDSE
jgi:hypothetical protein